MGPGAESLQTSAVAIPLQHKLPLMVYAGLGDKEQTFAWLEKTFEVRSGEMGKIRWYPPFAFILAMIRAINLCSCEWGKSLNQPTQSLLAGAGSG